MVVNPNDLMKKLNDADKKQVTFLEAKIDSFLQEEFNGTAAYFPLPDWNHRVKNEIIQNYERAGWNVRTHYDQRDGDCLIFEPQKISAEEYYNK